MSRYVVANWKSYKTMSEVEQWAATFCSLYRSDPRLQVIIAPPAVYLLTLQRLLHENGAGDVALAVQDLSPFPLGAYTGSLAAEMLRGIAAYAILGHAERRRYFHETLQDIANKVSEARAASIRPILCVDQPYARAQFAALHEEDLEDLIVGYAPEQATGIDMPQPAGQAASAIREIRERAGDRPILYGGSVTSSNVGEYIGIPGVSGVMAGKASLDAEEFSAICCTVSRL